VKVKENKPKTEEGGRKPYNKGTGDRRKYGG
jgi:hypothetical protein